MTNKDVFSSDLKVLESWKKLLKSKNYNSPLGRSLIQKVESLSKYNQIDLNIFEAILPDLSKITTGKISTTKNIIEMKEMFDSRLDNNENVFDEIPLFIITSPTNYEKEWILTTKRLFTDDGYDDLSEMQYMARMDDSMYLEDIDDEGNYCQIFTTEYISQEDITILTDVINKAICLYNIFHLPASRTNMSRQSFYYWHKIFPDMLAYDEGIYYEGLYDGKKISSFEDGDDGKIRNFAGETSYIFRYIDTTIMDRNLGMGLNNEGLNMLITEGLSDKSAFYDWDDLAESSIKGAAEWTAKRLYINDSSFNLGASKVDPEKWAEYLNHMISIYKQKMQYSDSYLNRLDVLTQDPKNYNIFYEPLNKVIPDNTAERILPLSRFLLSVSLQGL